MKRCLLFAVCLSAFAAEAPKPFNAQASSSISTTATPDGFGTIEIRNVTFETVVNVPGRKPSDFLVLRKTVQSKESIGDIGVEATVTLEAWPMGTDLKQKPLYKVNASGTDGHTQDSAVFIVSRGLEEIEWWSAYKLGTGQHLFDSYVPILSFSISRETVETRYAGLYIMEDEANDARLKQPNVIGVITYASADRVLHEVVLTADNPKQATQLRSFADETRTLTYEERPARVLKLTFTQNYPSAPNPVEVVIPITKDDLDLANAKLPPHLHVAVWKR